MTFKKNILCIGAGYVGGPTMAVIAWKCPEYRVTVVDIDPEKIERWQSDNLPIFEPGLLDVVRKCRSRNLFFSTKIPEEIEKADIIFVSVNTPTKTFGEGKDYAADLQYWEKTAYEILKYSKSDKIVVEKSTLPVRTAETLEKIFKANNQKNINIEVVSNPEFLAEGTAIRDLLEADRVLIGSHNTPSGQQAAEEIADIYRHWMSEERIIFTSIWSSELSKLVANAFLAQRISSINAIAALCEKTEANVQEIARAVGSDSRIGDKFLNASVGFGGSCFQKDILNLVYICRQYGLEEVADYWEGVLRINNYQKERFYKMIVREMFSTLVDKKIAVFGFAFKANTGDTRESPAIYICKKLLEEKAVLAITDPKALENARKDLAGIDRNVSFVEDPYTAVAEAQAIVVLTEWPEFRSLDYHRIYSLMKKPAFIFDGRNLLNQEELRQIGFNVFAIGKKPLRAI